MNYLKYYLKKHMFCVRKRTSPLRRFSYAHKTLFDMKKTDNINILGGSYILFCHSNFCYFEIKFLVPIGLRINIKFDCSFLAFNFSNFQRLQIKLIMFRI